MNRPKIIAIVVALVVVAAIGFNFVSDNDNGEQITSDPATMSPANPSQNTGTATQAQPTGGPQFATPRQFPENTEEMMQAAPTAPTGPTFATPRQFPTNTEEMIQAEPK